jgi:hypothetical protein
MDCADLSNLRWYICATAGKEEDVYLFCISKKICGRKSGQHGSWNRKPRSGYNVVFVPFRDSRPSGLPIEILTGFVDHDDKAKGRPVGVAIDKHGALLVADDVGNVIWRVTASSNR